MASEHRLRAGRAVLAVALALVAGGCRPEPAPKPGAERAAIPAPGLEVFAEVVRRSALPAPRKSDYPDCDFSCEMEVREIRSAVRTPRRILVMLPGFRKRELHWCASIAPGGMLDLSLVPAAAAPTDMKTRQRADDLDNFDLPVYHAAEVRRLERPDSTFEPRPDSYFLPAATPVAAAPVTDPSVRYPWSARAARERQTVMEREKAERLAALQNNGGSWDAWSDRISPFIIDINDKVRRAGGALSKDGAFFEKLHWKQYYELGRLADEDRPGPVKMLDRLNRDLRARGIDLIVVPFPYKEEVHADLFTDKAPADGWCEPWRQKFIMQLLDRDVEVVDLVPALRAARGRFPYVFYDAHDNHPAQGAIIVAAEQIARRLERYDLAARRMGAHAVFRTEEAEWVTAAEDAATGFTPGRHYPVTRVFDGAGRGIEAAQERSSPVVIMGDSYTITPAPMVRNASLPMHLARLIGEVPNQLLSFGSSDAAMNLLAREGGDFLADRCALVFVFAPTKLDGEASAPSGKRPWNWVDLPPLQVPSGAKR